MRLFALALLSFLLAAGAARAEPVQLAFRQAACAAPAPGWTSVAVSPALALEPLAPGWRLMVDQIRVSAIRLDVVTASGVVRRDFGAAALRRANALGNFIALPVPVAGRDVTAICLGLEGADSFTLLRSMKAATPAQVAAHRQSWISIAALVAGALICALAYNLFLFFWLKNRFQRWYVLWLVVGLSYMLVWSGVAGLAVPALAGASGIRVNLVLISTLIALGTAFFFDFVEADAVPKRLRRMALAIAALLPILGLAAAAELYVPAAPSDRLLNLGFLAATLLLGAGVAFGLARRSRAVWFYLAGWSLPLMVFSLRVARNFGALPQSDAVDKASFAALAFEAVVLSLAIADRFRSLLRERDTAEVEREMLRRVATTDPMTGLFNRAAFQQKIATLQSQRVEIDLLLLDLDDLKQTNDTAGHDAGDALLVEIGRRLVEAGGERAFVARLGGDEFAVLLAGGARDDIDRLLAFVDRSPVLPFAFAGRGLSASLSAGHARWLPSDNDGGDLYKKADLALYQAKASGRGCWRAFLPAMLDEREARHASLRSLRDALARGELVLHRQPIIDLKTGASVYDEALLRWDRPDHDPQGPDVFATAWDDPSTAAAVQEFVINMALDHLQAAEANGAPPRALSVNFLAGQLQGRDAAAHIVTLLADRGLHPSCLVVEVTESVALGRPGGPVVECLMALRDAGIRVALDDFGTGYASLVHLRDLSADILKIDRSFVMGVPNDEDSAKIVRAIVALAHSLGQLVVAEGVETEAQHMFLRHLGCDFAQGYLFGKAVPFTPVRGA